MAAFEKGLAERNLRSRILGIQYKFVPPKFDKLTEAAGLLSSAVDTLITWGTIAAVATKHANVACPVIFVSVGFPVAMGLVASLQRPGGNFTGISFEAADDTYGKRLQFLKEILPGVSRVGALGPADDANVLPALESVHRIADMLGIVVHDFKLRDVEELPSAFKKMEATRMQAVLIVAGAFAFVHRDRIAELALAHRLPSVHGLREGVAAGGLLSLGPDIVVMAAQAASYVEKIIRGAKPADLPVEQPARYEMHVNLKTARALNLTIPPSLLLRADEVIE